MQQYILRRLLLAVPTLFGVTVLIFIAMRIIPGDPLEHIYSEAGGIYILTDYELKEARASLGMDRPLSIQYLSWIGDVARGDMGKSFWTDTPIRRVIERRGPITLQIAIMSVVFSWIVGLPIGMIGAMWRNSLRDYTSRFIVTLFLAIPSFWLGLVVILVAVFYFSWRPPLEIVYIWDDPVANISLTVGPALAMGLGLAALIARMSRATLLEVFREDYVRTARAKGLGERAVVWRHVLRNALLPVITVSGIQLASLIGGSVAVERAFGVPGLGKALVQAITERDWMIIQNLVLMYGVFFVFINLFIDLLYGWIEPRIRYG
jgi:peptide/nickel transport system permease protein